MKKRKDVGREIHAVSNLLGRRVEAERRDRCIEDVTPVQIWVIRYLHEHRGRDVFQRDIERDFTVTRSTVTGILQLMEKNGYIERMTVPEDARLKKLVLTEKGERILQKVHAHVAETERIMTQGMTEEEIDTLLLLLDRVKKNLS